MEHTTIFILPLRNEAEGVIEDDQMADTEKQ